MTRGGVAPLALACPKTGGKCAGRLTIYVVETLPAKKKGHSSAFAATATTGAKARKRTRKVVIGRARYKLRAGQRKTIKVHISRHGRRSILRKRRQRCRISSKAGGKTVTRKITLKTPKRKP